MLRSAFVTDSNIVAEGSGGGVVSFHELNALQQISSLAHIYQNLGGLFITEAYHNNPFMLDYYYASLLCEPEKIELAHFYGNSFNLTMKMMCNAKKTVTICAHNLEDSLEEWNNFPYWSKPPIHLTDNNVFTLLNGSVYQAHRIICPSTNSANYIKSKFNKDATIIPHGTDIPTEYAVDKPEPFRVFHLSQFGPDKGQKYLINAWNQLISNGFKGELAIAGCPDIVQMITNYTDLKVFGYVSQPTKTLLYNTSSVYVQPSVSEAWGLGVGEAMAYGTPVIVAEGAGSKDMVTNGEDGFVVPIRDPQAIADKIQYFRDNPSEVKRVGMNARLKAEKYNWSNIEKMYQKAWVEN